jgi:hypothetical protein
MTRLIGILALVATVALGACGGSPAAGSTTSTTVDPDQAMLDFAKCMREHGVDMPDPETDGAGRGRVTFSAKAGGEETMDAAQKACQKYMNAAGPGSLDPEDRQKLQDAMVAFAKCMRAKGIDMPDPQTGSGGGIVMRAKPGQRPPEDDAEFTAAEKECREQHLVDVEKDLGLEGPSRSRGGGPAKGTSTGGGK